MDDCWSWVGGKELGGSMDNGYEGWIAPLIPGFREKPGYFFQLQI